MKQEHPDRGLSGEIRQGVESAMLRELYHILGNPCFVRSPTLARLLAYLVFETLKGNGDKLKSYTVAVDCLGRQPDFDAQSDSYPRVQIMRLRKLLDAFYAKHAPLEGICLYMVAGSYQIRMGAPENAYPELFRHARPPHGDAPCFPPEGDKGSEPAQTARSALSAFALAIAALLLIPLASFAILNGTSRNAKPKPAALADRAPVIVIDAVQSSANEAASSMADEIFATLIDGIGRSWVVRVRLSGSETQEAIPYAARYRLESRLSGASDGGRRLYLRLTDTGSSDLLWSSTIAIGQKTSPAERLGPAIARLAGPFGIVATRELERAAPNASGDYICLLHYTTFLKAQSGAARSIVEKCLRKPFANHRLNAVRLAFRSFFLIETAGPDNRQARLAQASRLAAQSLETDPKEAYAHFAVARLHYARGDCEAGNIHTRHAYEANPYGPVMLSVLGNFAAECGLEEAGRLIDRAFALRTPGESYAKLSLVLAAIRDANRHRLIALSSGDTSHASLNLPYHHLCETLIAAALDKPKLAQKHWLALTRSIGGRARPADEMLAHLIFSERVRTRIIAYLGERGALPAPASIKPQGEM